MREAELLFIKSCDENKPEEVQAYLTLAKSLKIDINCVDGGGVTAALMAAMKGHTKVISSGWDHHEAGPPQPQAQDSSQVHCGQVCRLGRESSLCEDPG